MMKRHCALLMTVCLLLNACGESRIERTGSGAAIGGGMDRFGSNAGSVAMSLFLIPGGILFGASLLGLLLLFPLWLVLSIVKEISKRAGPS